MDGVQRSTHSPTMKSAVICALLLTVHGKVFAERNEESDLRVINGMDASIEKFPYMVHLHGLARCGATVITYSHAFTAAHCVYNKNPAFIKVYGNSTSKTSGGVVFDVDEILIHPKYNHPTLDYDAAILHVTSTFRGYKYIIPLALQNAEVPAGTLCTVAGWGHIKKDISPDNLQSAVFKVLSTEECSTRFRINAGIMCAQAEEKGVDICNGDSGGPLVCDGKLTGAVSAGYEKECRGVYPTSFAKIMDPAIREFIRTSLGI